MTSSLFSSRSILGTRVDAVDYSIAKKLITDWAIEKHSRYVCVSNVHMVMEGYDSKEFQQIVNDADLITSDGMPLVFVLKMMGLKVASRVYGPTLTLEVCELAAKRGINIALYGGMPDSLLDFVGLLEDRFPDIKIVSAISPPFRELTHDEKKSYIKEIALSGARIVFVGIGCPKQERWMYEHRKKLNSVLIGVGAAFDFHSGRVKQAPSWMQKIGMEWFFRLLMEPRRLIVRYAKHNPRFIVLLAFQLLARKFK